jgi:hypothetical protein
LAIFINKDNTIIMVKGETTMVPTIITIIITIEDNNRG